jgi:uncharacterized damage-inducible protein DinB
MTTHEILKARFAVVRQDFDGVLTQLNDQDLDWRPADGMPKVRDLLLEIADKEREVILWIERGEWPDGDPPTFTPEHATLNEIKTAVQSLRAATYTFIDSKSEADLERLVSNPEGWWEALRIKQCPVSEILRNIAVHEWYHTGQLATYLWLMGRNPNNW